MTERSARENRRYRRCFSPPRRERAPVVDQRRAEVSDLTRGNLVFSSLNSKRSRVSLGLGTSGAVGGEGGAWVEAAAAAAAQQQRCREREEVVEQGAEEVGRRPRCWVA